MTNISDIIKGPIITEKSINAQSQGVYSFWVSLSATKSQIASAFKTIFKAAPLSVRTVRMVGKVKNDPRKRLEIQKPDRKRALVKVAKDTKIELLTPSAK